jgi:hypothetical protein
MELDEFVAARVRIRTSWIAVFLQVHLLDLSPFLR